MRDKVYQCDFCDTEKAQIQQHVTVTRQRSGQWYIFEQVPAWVCPNCGHRYFDADVLEAMERKMKARPDDARAVTACAISLSEM